MNSKPCMRVEKRTDFDLVKPKVIPRVLSGGENERREQLKEIAGLKKLKGRFKTMKTETKVKGIEEIISELREQAKEGRCLECQWCFPHEEVWCQLGFEGTKSTGEHTRKSSRLCLMEKDGFVDEVLHFFTDDLGNKQYPERCKVGSWTENDGTKIPECLAFSPNLDQVIMVMASKGDYRHPDIQPEIYRHRQYMETVIEASRLHNAIKNGRLEKLINELNGVAA